MVVLILIFLAFNELRIQRKENLISEYENSSFRVIALMYYSHLLICFTAVTVIIFSISPSGCTFWGKKPWSRKKKILWQLGTLVGAPVGIALIAGIAIPAMIIGIPVYVGRKVKCLIPY